MAKPSKRGGGRRPAMDPKTLRTLIERIQVRMAAMNLNASTTSARAGLGSTGIHDIINHKNQNPSLQVTQSIAKVLNCDVSYLTGERDTPRPPEPGAGVAKIPVIGMAEAGAFRTMLDFDPEIDHALRTVTARESRRFPKARLFALQVVGDSMNAARPQPILEGATVLCVDMIAADLDIESGQIYAVRRTLDDGQTWECTVKRAQVFRDRYELRPESANPRHETLVIPRISGEHTDDGKRIEAIGLVYGVFYDFEG